MERDDIMFMLGKIQSDITSISEAQRGLRSKLTTIDNRLRSVEIRSAKVGGAAGGISGGVIGVAVAILAESIKSAAKGAMS